MPKPVQYAKPHPARLIQSDELRAILGVLSEMSIWRWYQFEHKITRTFEKAPFTSDWQPGVSAVAWAIDRGLAEAQVVVRILEFRKNNNSTVAHSSRSTLHQQSPGRDNSEGEGNNG